MPTRVEEYPEPLPARLELRQDRAQAEDLRLGRCQIVDAEVEVNPAGSGQSLAIPSSAAAKNRRISLG